MFLAAGTRSRKEHFGSGGKLDTLYGNANRSKATIDIDPAGHSPGRFLILSILIVFAEKHDLRRCKGGRFETQCFAGAKIVSWRHAALCRNHRRSSSGSTGLQGGEPRTGGVLEHQSSPRAVASYRVTVLCALAATIFNVIFGLALAWVLTRYRFPAGVWSMP